MSVWHVSSLFEERKPLEAFLFALIHLIRIANQTNLRLMKRPFRSAILDSSIHMQITTSGLLEASHIRVSKREFHSRYLWDK